MKTLKCYAFLGGFIIPNLVVAEIPKKLDERLNGADLVLLAASKGRVLLALKGKDLLLGQATKEVRHATVVASHFEDPSITIKAKDKINYLNLKVINGMISLDGARVDIKEIIDRYKVPKQLVPGVFLTEKKEPTVDP